MTHDEAINICARHHDKWKLYRVNGRMKDRDNVFLELNLVHVHLYRVAQKLDCPTCLKDLVHNVFNWYEEQLKKRVNVEAMKYDELLLHARNVLKKEIPHNCTKETILKIIYG